MPSPSLKLLRPAPPFPELDLSTSTLQAPDGVKARYSIQTCTPEMTGTERALLAWLNHHLVDLPRHAALAELLPSGLRLLERRERRYSVVYRLQGYHSAPTPPDRLQWTLDAVLPLQRPTRFTWATLIAIEPAPAETPAQEAA